MAATYRKRILGFRNPTRYDQVDVPPFGEAQLAGALRELLRVRPTTGQNLPIPGATTDSVSQPSLTPPMVTPIEADMSGPTFALYSSERNRFLKELVESKLADGGLTADESMALSFLHEKILTPEAVSEAEREFWVDFITWTVGRPRRAEDERDTVWLKPENHVDPWVKNLSIRIPSIAAFHRTFVDTKERFKAQLEDLKIKGPSNLVEAYLYYKYIVRKANSDFLDDVLFLVQDHDDPGYGSDESDTVEMGDEASPPAPAPAPASWVPSVQPRSQPPGSGGAAPPSAQVAQIVWGSSSTSEAGTSASAWLAPVTGQNQRKKKVQEARGINPGDLPHDPDTHPRAPPSAATPFAFQTPHPVEAAEIPSSTPPFQFGVRAAPVAFEPAGKPPASGNPRPPPPSSAVPVEEEHPLERHHQPEDQQPPSQAVQSSQPAQAQQVVFKVPERPNPPPTSVVRMEIAKPRPPQPPPPAEAAVTVQSQTSSGVPAVTMSVEPPRPPPSPPHAAAVAVPVPIEEPEGGEWSDDEDHGNPPPAQSTAATRKIETDQVAERMRAQLTEIETQRAAAIERKDRESARNLERDRANMQKKLDKFMADTEDWKTSTTETYESAIKAARDEVARSEEKTKKLAEEVERLKRASEAAEQETARKNAEAAEAVAGRKSAEESKKSAEEAASKSEEAKKKAEDDKKAAEAAKKKADEDLTAANASIEKLKKEHAAATREIEERLNGASALTQKELSDANAKIAELNRQFWVEMEQRVNERVEIIRQQLVQQGTAELAQTKLDMEAAAAKAAYERVSWEAAPVIEQRVKSDTEAARSEAERERQRAKDEQTKAEEADRRAAESERKAAESKRMAEEAELDRQAVESSKALIESERVREKRESEEAAKKAAEQAEDDKTKAVIKAKNERTGEFVELQAKLKTANARLAELEQSERKARSEHGDSSQQVAKLQRDIASVQETLKLAQARVTELAGTVQAKDQIIETSKREWEAKIKAAEERAETAERTGGDTEALRRDLEKLRSQRSESEETLQKQLETQTSTVAQLQAEIKRAETLNTQWRERCEGVEKLNHEMSVTLNGSGTSDGLSRRVLTLTQQLENVSKQSEQEKAQMSKEFDEVGKLVQESNKSWNDLFSSLRSSFKSLASIKNLINLPEGWSQLTPQQKMQWFATTRTSAVYDAIHVYGVVKEAHDTGKTRIARAAQGRTPQAQIAAAQIPAPAAAQAPVPAPTTTKARKPPSPPPKRSRKEAQEEGGDSDTADAEDAGEDSDTEDFETIEQFFADKIPERVTWKVPQDYKQQIKQVAESPGTAENKAAAVMGNVAAMAKQYWMEKTRKTVTSVQDAGNAVYEVLQVVMKEKFNVQFLMSAMSSICRTMVSRKPVLIDPALKDEIVTCMGNIAHEIVAAA